MQIEAFELKPHPFPEATQEVHRPLPPVFGTESICYDQEGIACGLAVSLSESMYILPRRDVPKENPVNTIFNLDISDPEIFDAAADWFAKQLVLSEAKVLVTPYSEKSLECIKEAVRRANKSPELLEPIQLILLTGGEATASMNESEREASEIYYPITRPTEGKKMSMEWSDRVFLSRLTPEERSRIWLADDVLSTGATLEAMKRLLQKVVGEPINTHTLVIAVEAPIDEAFPPRVPDDVVAAMIIGEIPGGLPRKEDAA